MASWGNLFSSTDGMKFVLKIWNDFLDIGFKYFCHRTNVVPPWYEPIGRFR